MYIYIKCVCVCVCVCVCIPAATAVKSLQSCPTLCDPIEGSPPGSSVPGILQARILEWVAISSSYIYIYSIYIYIVTDIAWQYFVNQWPKIEYELVYILESIMLSIWQYCSLDLRLELCEPEFKIWLWYFLTLTFKKLLI